MNRYRSDVFTIASLSLGLLVTVPARAVSMTEVPVADWKGSVSVPSYVKMYIYVPTKLAAKPPIVVSGHSCGSSASGQMGNIPKTQAAADKNGFIIILPDNPGQNCWDVGNSTSLTHDGGGDTQAVALMVKYALTKYSGDATRVYIFGGSSGGMLTQAMLAVYPDVFKAGSARAGVPAGCWADSYKPADQWSDTCAGGNVTKTGQQWGDLVRKMYPGYTGHRPRIQLIQGGADTTISSKNMAESIKEWTNILGLSETATSSDKGYKGIDPAAYDRQFWKNTCGFTVLESWVAPGANHSMKYEEDAILKFFGLDTASNVDPEDEAGCSGGGSGGTAGAGGATASSGNAGRSSVTPNDIAGRNSGGGRAAALGGSSGEPGVSTKAGAAPSNGGSIASGGSANQAKGGSKATEPTPGNAGGAVGSGGSPSNGKGGNSSASTNTSASTAETGGSSSNASVAAKGGSSINGSGGSPSSQSSSSKGDSIGDKPKVTPADSASSDGCSLGVARAPSRSLPMAVGLLLALGLVSRRRR